ncbi:hypothetical protein AAULH_14381, partial [Lactobacillus helveticus MTCC 5463]
FDGVFDQRRQLAGHQDKVGVKALGEVIAIDIVVLLAQRVGELQALERAVVRQHQLNALLPIHRQLGYQ